jgi:GT2 family glycosyltransferase
MSNAIDFSVIIPNYNGAGRLEACLERLPEAVRNAPCPCEIIVVDDASTDGSADTAAAFPDAQLIKNDKNMGFGATCNRGAMRARGRIIYFLNNDVEVSPDFIAPLLNHFDDSEVFAVASHAHDENGRIVAGRNTPAFVSGFLKANTDENAPPDRPSITIYASGGGAAFDRDKFLALGGFDPLYHPFYWEDFDLGYRAWKRGMRVIYEPRSRVLHKTHGSIREAFSEQHVARISRRNQLICNWKNLTDANLRAAHFASLTFKTAGNVLALRPRFLPIISEAAANNAAIRDARKKEEPHIKRSDKDVFDCFRDISKISQ